MAFLILLTAKLLSTTLYQLVRPRRPTPYSSFQAKGFPYSNVPV